MRLCVYILLFFTATLWCCADGLPSWAQGLTGAQLKAAVKEHTTPAHFVKTDILEVLIELDDAKNTGTILNRFSNDIYSTSQSIVFHSLPVYSPNDSWTFRSNSESVKEGVEHDLYNYFPCPDAIYNTLTKVVLGPGVPTHSVRQAGNCTLGEWEDGTGVWIYPTDYAGELARSFLYMATVYPLSMAGSIGSMFLEDGNYPSIKKETLDLLLNYHFNSPPTNRERERNASIGAIQGNYNPFVEYPELAQLIWQSRASDSDEGNEDKPDDTPGNGNDIDGTPLPLKGRYSESDKWIWLVSPFISDDASWQIDGRPVADNKIAVTSLSKGEHLLEFRQSTAKGRLKIIVE